MSFSSLSVFTTNHIDSNTAKDSFNSNSDTVSFTSLADLTAHHLQKSSTLIDRTNSNGKTCLPNTNFVIPKLSIKKSSCSDLNNIQFGLSTIQKNINMQFEMANDRKKDDSMDSLERSISNVLALSRDCTNSNTRNNSHSVETKEDAILNVSGNRTPSPDPWMIDLSSALKEATSVVSNNYSYKNSKTLKDANNVTPNLNLYTSNQNVENPYDMLPTTLNLSCLKYVKLPYTKKSVSLFGRALCKTWKLKKPILKSQKIQYETIKRFDFSVPYTRAQRNAQNTLN
ncbi:hypothetical protein ANTPLA_LOCUS3690 [Anthophora plagiata]